MIVQKTISIYLIFLALFCNKHYKYSFIFSVLRDDFRLMPVDTRVASGDTAILKCIPPRGNPKPRIHWLKNGQPLSSSEPRWHVTEVGSLVIEAVQKSDEANYVCRAENMVGARDSETAGLDVHGEYLFIMIHGVVYKDFFVLTVDVDGRLGKFWYLKKLNSLQSVIGYS